MLTAKQIRDVYEAQYAEYGQLCDTLDFEMFAQSIEALVRAECVPVETLRDYLVAISQHVAHGDDRKAQADIGELLQKLAAPGTTPKEPT